MKMNFGLVAGIIFGATAFTFLELNRLLRLTNLRTQLASASLGDDEIDGLIHGDLLLGEGLLVRDAIRSQALAEYWRRWQMCGIEERDIVRGMVADLVRALSAWA